MERRQFLAHLVPSLIPKASNRGCPYPRTALANPSRLFPDAATPWTWVAADVVVVGLRLSPSLGVRSGDGEGMGWLGHFDTAFLLRQQVALSSISSSRGGVTGEMDKELGYLATFLTHGAP